MRHLKAHRKLGRTTEHRMSLLRNLATSLITAKDERVITTVPKAKELRSFVERAITLARRATNIENDADGMKALHLRRQAAGFFHAGNHRVQTLARSHYWANKKAGGKIPERTAGVAAVIRLFNELGERYKDRNGGYTRIIRLGWREGDNAEMALIELVDNPREITDREGSDKKSKETAKKKKTTKKKSDE